MAQIQMRAVFSEVYIDPNEHLCYLFRMILERPTPLNSWLQRIWKQEVWAIDISNRKDLMSERNRYQHALEQQSDREKFRQKGQLSFLIIAIQSFQLNGYNIYIDEHIRRRAAMRLGINLAGHSNLKVHLEGHLYNTNFMHVTLPEFGGIDGVIGLHRKEDGNQWISTINNGDDRWWVHESKIVSEKDVDKPITHYLRIFGEILNDRYGLKKSKKPDANFKTIIKFPKNLTLRVWATAPHDNPIYLEYTNTFAAVMFTKTSLRHEWVLSRFAGIFRVSIAFY